MANEKLAVYQCPKSRQKKASGMLEICGFTREKVLGVWRCRLCEPAVFEAAGVPTEAA